MATLLLQCVAPLQSWGTQSEYIVRDTGREPSKSGIIGLLCAALGRDRAKPLDDLAQLRMGVRVDHEGKILRDFHTITNKLKSKPSTTLSTRYYLTDAMFLVGLEGEIGLLSELNQALKRPVWSLFLGRKSCPPSRPTHLPDGLKVDQDLKTALSEYPWLGQNKVKHEEDGKQLRMIIEDMKKGQSFVKDQPVSFAKFGRKFHPRRTATTFIDCPRYEPEASYPLMSFQEIAQ
ncbi:MAG: type I-E CRISPR-associated protein Cas5/CasD [Chloroflexota bacterium]